MESSWACPFAWPVPERATPLACSLHPQRAMSTSPSALEPAAVIEPVTTVDLVALVAAFTGFLDVGEAERAAALWDVPALILGDSHVHGPLSLERVARWLALANDDGTHAAAGHAGSGSLEAREWPNEPLIERVDWVSARVASVETRWPHRPRGGLLAGVHATTFLIRVDQFGQAKIRGLLLHSESQRSSET